MTSNSNPEHISRKKHGLKDAWTPVFTEALFTIARTWKQPTCPLTGEGIKQVWYIYTMEYYSATKKEQIGVHSSEVDEL